MFLQLSSHCFWPENDLFLTISSRKFSNCLRVCLFFPFFLLFSSEFWNIKLNRSTSKYDMKEAGAAQSCLWLLCHLQWKSRWRRNDVLINYLETVQNLFQKILALPKGILAALMWVELGPSSVNTQLCFFNFLCKQLKASTLHLKTIFHIQNDSTWLTRYNIVFLINFFVVVHTGKNVVWYLKSIAIALLIMWF